MFGTSIVTILIVVILILFSNYQEYMVNLTRNKGNWEARFSNIYYNQAKIIESNEKIREISIYQKLGITEENFSKDEMFTIKFDVRAYDKNALKNANIHIFEGRLPEASDEILLSIDTGISNMFYEKVNIGEKVKVTINGEPKEYLVVRKN